MASRTQGVYKPLVMALVAVGSLGDLLLLLWPLRNLRITTLSLAHQTKIPVRPLPPEPISTATPPKQAQVQATRTITCPATTTQKQAPARTVPRY